MGEGEKKEEEEKEGEQIKSCQMEILGFKRSETGVKKGFASSSRLYVMLIGINIYGSARLFSFRPFGGFQPLFFQPYASSTGRLANPAQAGGDTGQDAATWRPLRTGSHGGKESPESSAWPRVHPELKWPVYLPSTSRTNEAFPPLLRRRKKELRVCVVCSCSNAIIFLSIRSIFGNKTRSGQNITRPVFIRPLTGGGTAAARGSGGLASAEACMLGRTSEDLGDFCLFFSI